MTLRERRRRFLIVALVALGVALLLMAAWRWTPLNVYLQPKMVANWLRSMASSPWMPAIVVAVYVASNAVMFPNTVLCFATILAFGTVKGFWFATGGSLIAAIAAYLVGRWYGPEPIRKLKIKSLERMTKALQHGGIVQITTLRLLPLAPFTVVNVMAGVAHVRPMPYIVGTFLGLLPGNLLFTAFGRQLRQLIANPSPTAIALLVAVTVLGSVALWYLQKFVAARAP